MKFSAKLLILLFVVILFQSCSDNPSGLDFSDAPPPFDTSQALSDTTYEDGLIIYVIEEGGGPFEVVSNDAIGAFFTGRTTDGTIFDSSYRNGSTSATVFQNLTPTSISNGVQVLPPLIDGFRRGLLGMKEGEKRTIVIPPSLGYGDSQSGTNGFNLRNDTLIFDVELDRIISP